MKNRAASESDLFDRGEEAWRAEGDFGLLAAVNPARVALAREIAGGDLAGKRVLDAGCGGGIFAEAAARAGAQVTAIDPRAARHRGGGGARAAGRVGDRFSRGGTRIRRARGRARVF